MLQCIDLAVEFDRIHGPLFEGLNLSISRHDKIALVGANGSGKSALMRVLAGQEQPTRGRVVLARNCHVAMLRQELSGDGGDLEVAGASFRAWYSRLAGSLSYSRLCESTLSPGERLRVELALLLSQEPDLLLLDEPSNHLDIAAREWLGEFLQNSPIGWLMVTHDRDLADRAATRTLELARGRLTEYAGGYTQMLDAKRRRQHNEQIQFETEKAEVRRLKNVAEATRQRALQMTKKPKRHQESAFCKPYYAAMESKLARRAAAVRKRVEQAEERLSEKPFEGDALSITFPTAPIRSGMALEVRGASKQIEGKLLFEGLNLDVEAGERMALLGANGTGKTTLLRAIMRRRIDAPTGPDTSLPSMGRPNDLTTLDSGTVSFGRGVRVGYLSQTPPFIEPSLTVLEALAEYGEEVRHVMGALGLRGDFPERPIGVLSCGERTRVELTRVLLSGANLLLLDEPTNHLDLPALEALEAALNRFEGSVLFCSHDPAFVRRYAHRELWLGR